MSQSIKCKSTPQGNIYYALADKESQSALSFNSRLLVLLEDQCLGYVSKPNLQNLQDSLNLQKLKIQVPLRSIIRITVKSNILSMIVQKVKNQLKWTFKMKSEQQALLWEDLIQRQISPGPSRKVTTHSPDINQFSINIQKVQSTIPKQEQSPIKQEPLVSKNNEPFLTNKIEKSSFTNQQKSPSINNKIESGKIQEFEKDKLSKIPINGQQSQIKSLLNGDNEDENKKIEVKSVNLQSNKLMSQNSSLFTIQPNLDPIVQIERKQQIQQLYDERHKQFDVGITAEISGDRFVNYFRLAPKNINQQFYALFHQYAMAQFIKLLEGKVQSLRDYYYLSQEERRTSKKRANNETPPKNPLIVALSDITITIPLTQIKQIPSSNGGNNYAIHNICDQSLLKQQLQQMKNVDYIWQCLMRDGESIIDDFYIPVGCVCEYAGWVGYVKSNYNTELLQKKYSDSVKKDTSKIFDKLAEITKINRYVFQDSSAIKLIPTKNNKFIIASVKKYLPRNGDPYVHLRKQAFTKIYSKQLYTHNSSLKEQQSRNRIHNEYIINSITNLAKSIDRVDSYVMDGGQITELFHRYGINIRQIGKLQRTISNGLMKMQLRSEAAARALKIIFRKKMQEQLSLESETRSVLGSTRVIRNLMNLVVGKGEESMMIWKLLTLHSQSLFEVGVSSTTIHKGYLILAIQHHLGIRVRLNGGVEEMFQRNDLIQGVELVFKTKTMKQNYIPINNNRRINMLQVINDDEGNQEHVDEIIKCLRSGQSKDGHKVPPFLSEGQKQKLINYLCNFIPPGKYHGLGLYSSNLSLTVLYCKRQLLLTKWKIKTTTSLDHDQVLAPLIALHQRISFYYNHIAYAFLSDIHDLIEQYFLQKGLYVEAVHHAKSALTNMLQVCANNMHIKIANHYYQLALCYIHCIGKKISKIPLNSNNPLSTSLLSNPHSISKINFLQESLTVLKKSKNILETNLMTSSPEYSLVEYQLGRVLLFLGKDSESSKTLMSSLRGMQTLPQFTIEEVVACYQLLIRSFSTDKSSYYDTSRRLLYWIYNLNSSPNNISDRVVENVLRIAVEGHLLNFNKSSTLKNLGDYISDLEVSQTISSSSALKIVRGMLIDGKLKTNLQDILSQTNVDIILMKIKSMNRVKLQKDESVLQFQYFLQILNIVLMEGFIVQSLSRCYSLIM